MTIEDAIRQHLVSLKCGSWGRSFDLWERESLDEAVALLSATFAAVSALVVNPPVPDPDVPEHPCFSFGHQMVPAAGEAHLTDMDPAPWVKYCAECLEDLRSMYPTRVYDQPLPS